MTTLRFLAHLLSISMTLAGVAESQAQEFPTKPIRIITTPIGGGNDFVARLIGIGLGNNLGQSVIVENRPTGTIATQQVSKSPADGYTLLVYGSGFWITPLLQKTPYEVRDLTAVTAAVTVPQVLVVHPSLPVKSVKELVALAKAKPGELNYASAAPGSSTHLASELFKSLSQADMLGIPYAAPSAARIDLLTGRVQVLFASPAGVLSDIKTGKLRALAVTSARPSVLFRELPTVASSLPGYQSEQVTGVFAPANTPAAVITRLNQEIVRVLRQQDVKDKFLATGVETVGNTSEEFSAYIKADISRVAKLIKEAGIKIE